VAAAILMYDVGKRDTFDGLKGWLDDVELYGPANVVKAIVANKADLLDHEVNIN
jgi:GTPase SAR1 family protein